MNRVVRIHLPTEEEKQEALAEFARDMRVIATRQREAIRVAVPALARLIEVCANKTGQSYHVRSLLFSAWNGKPTSISNLLNLDGGVKSDVCAVLLAFGYEPGGDAPAFFYDAMQQAFHDAGLFKWFQEEAQVAGQPD